MSVGTTLRELDAMAQGAKNAGQSIAGGSGVVQGYNEVRKAAAVISFATHFASRKSEEALVNRVEELQRQASSSIAANPVAAGYQGSGMSNGAIQSNISSRISDNNDEINICNNEITSARDAISKIDFSKLNAMDEYKKQTQAIADAQDKIASFNAENEMLSKAGADFNTLDRMNGHSSSLDAARSDILAGQQNARYVQTTAINKLLGGSFVGDAYNTFNTARMITGQIKNMHHKSVKASLERRIRFNERTKAHINNLIARTTPGSRANRKLNRASRRLDRNSANARKRIHLNNMRRTKAGRKKLADDNRALKAAERKAARRGRRDASFRGLEKQKADLAREINMARADARSNFMGKGNKTGFYKSDEYKEFLRKNSPKHRRLQRLNKKIQKRDRTRAFFSRWNARITGVKNRMNNWTLRKARITAFFSKLNRFNPINLLRMAAAKAAGIVAAAVLHIILYVAVATGAIMLISFFILHFASTLINSMRTDLTGGLDGSQNWCQLILDHLYYDMGQEFEQVIRDDAFSHYFTYYYIVTPYYNVPLSVDYSTFGKSWIWEEADNTSRWVLSGDITDFGETDGFDYGNPLFTVNDGVERTYDADGYLVSANAVTWEEGRGESLDTYKDISGAMEGAADMITWGNNADKLRTNVDPRLNVFPIMAMMHTKYIDNLNYEEWVTALAYTYYMYAMSHDIAKYDSNDSFRNFNLGGNDNGVDYLEEMRENEGMSGYNVNVFFHGDRVIQQSSSSAGKYSVNYVYVNSDYMGTGQHVYFFNNNVWNRAYQSSGPGCDNLYFHSAAAYADENGNIIKIGNGLSGQEDDTGEDHINGIYCETNVKLVQLFRRAVYEYIYSSAGDTAFSGHQALAAGSQMDYTYTVYFLYELANGTESGYGGTGVDDLCKMMGISVEYLRDNIYIPPSDDHTHFYGRLGVTVNGIPGVQGYPFTFGDNAFKPTYDWRWCNNYVTIDLAEPAFPGAQGCRCGGGNARSIYDEAYDKILHNGACYVYHEVSGYVNNNNFNNGENSGDSGTGCGWVYECNRMPNNDHRADGSLCHTHDKDGSSCAKHWQCNCERYHIEDTVYVCAGHCAGHLIPSTTVVQRLSYEGLAQGDGFKTTYWLTVNDITGDTTMVEAEKLIAGSIFGLGRALGEMDDAMMEVTELRTNIILKYGTNNRMPSLPEWKLFWLKRAQGWFNILPNSPRAFYTVIGKRFIYAAAGGIDFFTNNLADFLENVFINHKKVWDALKDQMDIILALEEEAADPMDEKTLGDNSARDKLGFQGWFAPASDYPYPTRYSQSAMSELKTFYGSFYDSNGNIVYQDPQKGFLVGVRNWKEFDVYFPEELLNTLGQEGYYGSQP